MVLSRRVFRSIVILVVLCVLLAATSILFTVGYVSWQHHAHLAALKRQQAVAAAAQQKAAVPLCKALLHLAEIKGSHGDSGATYGANLQTGLQHVYAATNCSTVLKEKP